MIPFISILKRVNPKNILLVVLVLLIIYSGVQTVRISRLKDGKKIAETERDQFSDLINEKDFVIERYINKHNQEIARVEAITLSHENVIRTKDSEYLKLLNQFEGLKKNYRNLVATASFDMTMFGEGVPEPERVIIPCKDTLRAFKYRVYDDYNNIEILAVEPPKHMDIRIPLDAVINWNREKKFWFIKYGPKVYSMQAYTPNKLVKIDSMRIIRVEKGKE